MSHCARKFQSNESAPQTRPGKLSLLLALGLGLGITTGCTTSSPGTNGNEAAPAAIPDQGAANPTSPSGPLEPTQPVSGPSVTDSETNPDSGGDQPGADLDTDQDAESGTDSEPGQDADPDADSPTDADPTPTPTPTPLTQVQCDAAPSAIQTRMLELINETRASARNCGDDAFAATTPLVWNDTLETAAAAHSLDMSSVNFFSHTGSNGSNIVARANAVNYNYRALGENLAAGQRTAAAAMQGLVNSPGHCANLMNPAYREVGVACSTDEGADFTYYWTQVFGRQ